VLWFITFLCNTFILRTTFSTLHITKKKYLIDFDLYYDLKLYYNSVRCFHLIEMEVISFVFENARLSKGFSWQFLWLINFSNFSGMLAPIWNLLIESLKQKDDFHSFSLIFKFYKPCFLEMSRQTYITEIFYLIECLLNYVVSILEESFETFFVFFQVLNWLLFLFHLFL